MESRAWGPAVSAAPLICTWLLYVSKDSIVKLLPSNRRVSEWLAGNFLFRKLFLIRKVFLAKRRLSHYSQFAEDISIRGKFPADYQGFFVDVGCFHPFKFNNTWLLYKRGWRGVNIDIDDIKIEAFNMIRKQDENIAACVSDQTGSLKFYRNGLFSVMNSVDEEFGKKHGQAVSEVPARSLTSIIDDTRFSGRHIDLLSVDAEGHDLNVIKSLDFERYRPKLIAVETHEPTFDRVQETALYQHLEQLGYTMVAWCGFTLLMASSEHCRQLTSAA